MWVAGDIDTPYNIHTNLQYTRLDNMRDNEIEFVDFSSVLPYGYVYVLRRGNRVYYTTECDCIDDVDATIRKFIAEGIDPLKILEFLEL
jgi:hypothetical protein